MKKFKVKTVLILDTKKRNYCRIFHSSAKIIASDTDIDEAFISMHLSITTEIRNFTCEDWIFLDAIMKHIIKIFECFYKEKK